MKSICFTLPMIALSLAACEDDGTRCVRSHSYTVFIPIVSGKTTILMPTTHTICDEHVVLPRRKDAAE